MGKCLIMIWWLPGCVFLVHAFLLTWFAALHVSCFIKAILFPFLLYVEHMGWTFLDTALLWEVLTKGGGKNSLLDFLIPKDPPFSIHRGGLLPENTVWLFRGFCLLSVSESNLVREGKLKEGTERKWQEWRESKGKPTYAQSEFPEAIQTMQCSKHYKI